MKAMICAGATTLGMGVSALAQPTVFVTVDQTMYRLPLGGSPTAFQLDDAVRGLTARSDGTLFAVSPALPDNGEPEFYEILNPYSNNPVLTPTSVQTDFGWSAVSEARGLLYGLGSDGDLFEIDPGNNYAQTLIGYTGLTDVGGMAYDAVNDRLLALDNDSDAVYPLDWGSGAAGSALGALGVDSISCGMEWFGGTLYAVVQNATDDELQIGTIDLGSGAYSAVQTLGSGALRTPTAIAVVPAPATLALLGLGGTLGFRRR